MPALTISALKLTVSSSEAESLHTNGVPDCMTRPTIARRACRRFGDDRAQGIGHLVTHAAPRDGLQSEAPGCLAETMAVE